MTELIAAYAWVYTYAGVTLFRDLQNKANLSIFKNP